MFAGSDLRGWSEGTCFGLGKECAWKSALHGPVVLCDFGLLLVCATSNGAGRGRMYDGGACRRLRNGPLSICLRRKASACDAQLIVAKSLRDKLITPLHMIIGEERCGVDPITLCEPCRRVERAEDRQARKIVIWISVTRVLSGGDLVVLSRDGCANGRYNVIVNLCRNKSQISQHPGIILLPGELGRNVPLPFASRSNGRDRCLETP